METLENILQTTLQSFDFGYCIIVNVLTYVIIKIINDIRKKDITKWAKRGVLISSIFVTGVLYWLVGSDLKLTINSAILAPVFWSWIMKPVCAKLGIDYKQINVVY